MSSIPPPCRKGVQFLDTHLPLGVQTCEPGTHPSSHLPHSPPFHPRQHGRGVQPAGPHPRCEPQTLQTLFSWQSVAKCRAVAPRIGISLGRTLSSGRAAASRSGQRHNSSEVSIPNAHPLFREETPESRECVDFIGGLILPGFAGNDLPRERFKPLVLLLLNRSHPWSIPGGKAGSRERLLGVGSITRHWARQ